MVSEFLALLGGDLALAFEIALVADEDAGNVVCSVLLDLSHPVLNSAERLTISDVVGDDDTVGTLVVAGSDSFEALLTCSIPNLKLDSFSVNFVIANLEVHADRGHKALRKSVFLYCKRA